MIVNDTLTVTEMLLLIQTLGMLFILHELKVLVRELKRSRGDIHRFIAADSKRITGFLKDIGNNIRDAVYKNNNNNNKNI